MRETFSASETSSLTGVPYRTLDHWARTRFIVPSSCDAQGRGSERRYTFKDLVALRVAKELRSGGISTQALRRIIQFLRRKGIRDPLSELRLVVRGKDVFAVHGAEQLTSVLIEPGQFTFVFILDVTKTVQALETSVAKLKAA